VSDHSRIRSIFGPRDTVPLEEGIRRTVSWARTVVPAPRRPFGTLEIDRELPPSWATLASDES
jgi:hypothetical protein